MLCVGKSLTFLFFLLFWTMAFLPGTSWSAEGQAQYVMKFASVIPNGTIWSDCLGKVKSEIEQKTGGKLKVTLYLGAVMGDEPDELRKIRLGQLHGAGFTIMGMGLIDPALQILEIPFLPQNNEEIDFVYSKMNLFFSRMFEAKGFVLAGLGDVGFVYIFTQEPILSLNDLPRFKMWTYAGDPVPELFLKRAGFVNLVATPLPETLTALQTGMVNAFYSPLYGVLGLQWYTQVKYISSFTFGFVAAAILLDKKFFNSLPPEFQKIVMDAWDHHFPGLIRQTRLENDKAHKFLLNRGIKVGATPPEVLEEIQKRIYPLRSELVNKYYPEYLLSGIQNALNEFRIQQKGTH